jgi:carboxyl-terminal processing protease
LKVVSPIEGSPAYGAGIKAGDHIVKVGGEHTKDMRLWEAVKKMRGKKGTSVVITVVREGLAEPVDYTIVRDVIPLQSVRYYTLKPGYGYLRITNFRDNTFEDAKEALNDLGSGETPLNGLILDLRDNPGGLLDQAVKTADIFLETGHIVSIKGRGGSHSKTYSAHSGGCKPTYPVVLLINEGSASASEIVAGALQDHGRALILGATSFGKGSVQSVEPLRDGSGLKLTIARYYTPNGNAIQAEGIKPDVVVKDRFVPEAQPPKKHHMQEKDLKNHISAIPGEATRHDPKEQIKHMTNVNVPGRKDFDVVEHLLTRDNQVQRGLEILTSWQIFSRMAK